MTNIDEELVRFLRRQGWVIRVWKIPFTPIGLALFVRDEEAPDA